MTANDEDDEVGRSTWNYRVMRKRADTGDEYFLGEAIYDDAKITGWTEGQMAPFGQTLEELKKDLGYMNLALEKPVLDYDSGLEVDDDNAS